MMGLMILMLFYNSSVPGSSLTLSLVHSNPAGCAVSDLCLGESRFQPSNGSGGRYGAPGSKTEKQAAGSRSRAEPSAWFLLSFRLQKRPLGFLGLLMGQDREAALRLIKGDMGLPSGSPT